MVERRFRAGRGELTIPETRRFRAGVDVRRQRQLQAAREEAARRRAEQQPPPGLTPEQAAAQERATAERRAIELVNRKLQGKRIVLVGETRAVRDAYARLVEREDIREALDTAAELTVQAREAGFASAAEFQAAREATVGEVRIAEIKAEQKQVAAQQAAERELVGRLFQPREEREPTFTERARDVGQRFLFPFGETRTAIGGVLVERKEFEKLTPEQQRLVFAAQPEAILGLTQFPRVETVGVTFAGVKTAVKGDKTFTALQFKTTAGERGAAVSVGKVIGQADDALIGEAQTAIVKVGKGSKELQKFAAVERGVLFQKGDRIFQVTGGRIASTADDVAGFKAFDFGKISDDVLTIGGKTIVKGRDVLSFGKIADIAKFSDDIVSTAGVTTTKLTSTFASVTTQAAARAAITPVQTVTTATISPAVTTGFVATQSVQPTTQPSITGQVTAQKSIVTPKVATTTAQLPRQISVQAQAAVPATAIRTAQTQTPVQIQAISPRISPRQRTAQITAATVPTIPVQTPTRPPRAPLKLKPIAIPTARRGRFVVEVRRRGRFRPIGRARTIGQAVSIGAERVAGTLAATFRIRRPKGIRPGAFKTPKGFKRKRGLTFIEAPRLRLSRPTETQEIKIAKLKGGR